MASTARIFFAGVGTTFLIIGVGFSGGLLMANAALKEPALYPTKAKAEPSAIRVIMPASAEAAQPPLPSAPVQGAAVEAAPEPIQVTAPEKPVHIVDTKKVEKEERNRRKRIAERKAKRQQARARALQVEPRQEPRIMAYDEPSQQPLSLFGN
jgi:hypothetical protein